MRQGYAVRMNNYDFLTTNEQLGIPIAPCRGIRIPVEFYLWNPEYSSRNPQAPLGKTAKAGYWNSESTVWDPGSKTVLDFLTWGDP